MGIDSALPPQHSLLFLQNLHEFCSLKTFTSLTKFVNDGQQIEKLWGKAGGTGRQTVQWQKLRCLLASSL